MTTNDVELTPEAALERLIIYTAMEDGQLAYNCERVLKAHITSLSAERDEAKADYDRRQNDVCTMMERFIAAEARAQAAEARVAELEAGLKPFARAADSFDGHEPSPDDEIWSICLPDGTVIPYDFTVGQVRRAARLLNPPERGEG